MGMMKNRRGLIRRRKGMIIKNADKVDKTVQLATRTLDLSPGETVALASAEVTDPALRDLLQVRALAIVRPLTDEEEIAIRDELGLPQEALTD